MPIATQKDVCPLPDGRWRYRLFGGDNPNGIAWEINVAGNDVEAQLAAQTELDDRYYDMMEESKSTPE